MSALFTDHREAARALLTHPEPKLVERSGQFLGGIMFRDEPLTEKQQRWLQALLDKHGLPALATGGTNGR